MGVVSFPRRPSCANARRPRACRFNCGGSPRIRTIGRAASSRCLIASEVDENCSPNTSSGGWSYAESEALSIFPRRTIAEQFGSRSKPHC